MFTSAATKKIVAREDGPDAEVLARLAVGAAAFATVAACFKDAAVVHPHMMFLNLAIGTGRQGWGAGGGIGGHGW